MFIYCIYISFAKILPFSPRIEKPCKEGIIIHCYRGRWGLQRSHTLSKWCVRGRALTELWLTQHLSKIPEDFSLYHCKTERSRVNSSASLGPIGWEKAASSLLVFLQKCGHVWERNTTTNDKLSAGLTFHVSYSRPQSCQTICIILRGQRQNELAHKKTIIKYKMQGEVRALRCQCDHIYITKI